MAILWQKGSEAVAKKEIDGLVAVIYARYSSENQREESIEGQLRENYEFAKNNGITVIGEYIDRAFSAKTDRRPDFQRKENSTLF